MQWHSDGAQGEATMLLSLDSIDDNMGCLKVVPGSHRKYVRGTGHSEVTLCDNYTYLLCLNELLIYY